MEDGIRLFELRAVVESDEGVTVEMLLRDSLLSVHSNTEGCNVGKVQFMPLVPCSVPEVMQEECRQANEEVRRLRRGITEILKGRSPKGPKQERTNWSDRMANFGVLVVDDLNDLIAGEDATPLRPEWNHHTWKKD